MAAISAVVTVILLSTRGTAERYHRYDTWLASRRLETPLLAFLVPFSAELWVTIFISLNVTALAVAIYEWLSPFGLNPWGRQRTKNFSYGSALWVIWGLLFSHLVAFKAPKSWPNKVLINVWGAFSVIFVASYTANIAALFAGLFNRRDTHGRSFYSLRVGAIRFSASEFYISTKNPSLWAHIKGNLVANFTDALDFLHSGRLEVLVGDAAILDHMRANDPGCTLQSAGPDLVDDTYAVAMPKGFPLKMKINAAISQYVASGHLEYLRHKWYGSSPCFRLTADIYKPQPLEFATVAGVFLMLTLGIAVGIFILFLEHIVYRYALPSLRTKPKTSIWRNRNLMFFSQKMYKYVNCYELVSPHHSAKELVNNLRTGQIMGLFQKSVKRKENEQRRRRKSKAQFFEMIQEIRRVQKAEKSIEMSSSMEILEANTAANRNILPEATSFTTSFTASVTSDAAPHPPPSTASIHSPSSTTLRVGGSSSKGGKSPPGITIDYIPGPNPEEDYEGILIVNRRRSSSHGGEKSEAKKKRRKAKTKEGPTEDGEGEMGKGSKSSLSNSYFESPLKIKCKKEEGEGKEEKERKGGGEEGEYAVVGGEEDEEDEKSSSKSSKEARKKKRRKRRLERSSRVESSAEDGSNGLFTMSEESKQKIAESKRGHIDQKNNDEGYAMTAFRQSVSPLPSAVSAPASLFGEDSACECERLREGLAVEQSQPPCKLPSPRSPWIASSPSPCSPATSKETHFKSRSLDEAEIQPPSDFMSPVLSPTGTPETRGFTSMSFPCSPHVFESPSANKGAHLQHFLSEGDERWGDWERQQRYFANRPSETVDCSGILPATYHSSAAYHHNLHSKQPRYYSSEPTHLRSLTKGDLWRMWQDSEIELRQRLFQVEEERNLLASHLSHKYKAPSEAGNTYEGEVYRRREHRDDISSAVDPSGCLNVELEVPFEFRDPTSKDLRRSRYTRSLDEGRQYRSSPRGPDSGTYMDYTHCDDLLGCKNTMEKGYDDFFRSVRSLEESLLGENDLRSSEARRKSHYHRSSKSKIPKRRRDPTTNPRRCKSSLDSRRSRSLARESYSGSSESPKTERMSISSFDSRNISHGVRGRNRKKKTSPSQLGDFSDRSSVSRDYRRRKSKSAKGDKLPFLSLPRNKPQQHRKKYSSTLSYCSQSSSSDQEETLTFGRQYAEPSPLPLLQSLQRHSLGKQQRTVTSIHNQKQKSKHSDPLAFDSRHSKKSLRKISPYVERVPYLVREGTCPSVQAELHHRGCGMPQGNRGGHRIHHGTPVTQGLGHVTHITRRRSSLDIPEPRSVSELY